jgi:hypothetical protein
VCSLVDVVSVDRVNCDSLPANVQRVDVTYDVDNAEMKDGEERFWGFDDESVLYRAADGKGGCIQDEPELLEAILELCRNYFAEKDRGPRQPEAERPWKVFPDLSLVGRLYAKQTHHSHSVTFDIVLTRDGDFAKYRLMSHRTGTPIVGAGPAVRSWLDKNFPEWRTKKYDSFVVDGTDVLMDDAE